MFMLNMTISGNMWKFWTRVPSKPRKATPGMRSGFRNAHFLYETGTDGRSGTRTGPGTAPGTIPGTASETAPETAPGTTPGTALGTAPEIGDEMRK